jgi:hypothetical protein
MSQTRRGGHLVEQGNPAISPEGSQNKKKGACPTLRGEGRASTACVKGLHWSLTLKSRLKASLRSLTWKSHFDVSLRSLTLK